LSKVQAMRRTLVAALGLLALLAPTAHAAPPEMTPYVAGPDREPASKPSAVLVVHDKAAFSWGLKPPTIVRTVTRRLPAPPKEWDRVILEFTDVPTDDEPWDRVFSVAVGSVELIRGTTPRTAMTVRKDVTEYLPLLGRGGLAKFTTQVGTYVGGHAVTVRLEFYKGESRVVAPAGSVVGAFSTFGIEPEHKDVSRHRAAAKVRFPSVAPKTGVVELTTTGHLQGGEFWYLPDRGSTTPPVIRLFVDNVEIATAHAAPYVYALAGFERQNGTAHPLMWWTAQKALDSAGVHTGTGEIPPYRATLGAGALALLKGTHRVEVSVEGKGLWITSVSFLLG
jgi:hypothetical protein